MISEFVKSRNLGFEHFFSRKLSLIRLPNITLSDCQNITTNLTKKYNGNHKCFLFCSTRMTALANNNNHAKILVIGNCLNNFSPVQSKNHSIFK